MAKGRKHGREGQVSSQPGQELSRAIQGGRRTSAAVARPEVKGLHQTLIHDPPPVVRRIRTGVHVAASRSFWLADP
ncbi:hypothetical protein EMIT0111MI5_40514 [Burkholderia sp. IT-111MI5]